MDFFPKSILFKNGSGHNKCHSERIFHNMDKERFNIAVVGESMAGKSSWIASLYAEEITDRLKEICRLNSEGQTKVVTHYVIVNDTSEPLTVTDIGWSEEITENEALKTIKAFFGWEKSGKAAESFRGPEFKTSLAHADPIKVLKNLVNKEEIAGSGIITSIELTGGASAETCAILTKYAQNRICIKDTRGFLDETTDKMAGWLKERKDKGNKEEDYIQKLLDDRGIYGIDACVFMSVANANALNKKQVKGIYGPLIRELLMKYPTFLVIREPQLTKELSKPDGRPYIECCDKIISDSFFSGFDSIRALLDECGFNDPSPDYRTAIAHKHYKELLLANIAQKRIVEDRDIYRKSAVGVLDEVLKGVVKYLKDIKDAAEFLKKMRNPLVEMKKIFDAYFDGSIDQYAPGKYRSSVHYCLPSALVSKIQGPFYTRGNCVGMVGAYGGLTTYIEGRRVGQVAIDLLESAYDLKDYLYRKYVDDISFAEIRALLPKGADSEEEAKKMRQKIAEKYQRDLDSNFEILSRTTRMIPRWYLEEAYERTRSDLEISEGKIGKYLREFENRYPEPGWENEKYLISAVKYITWLLIGMSVPG